MKLTTENIINSLPFETSFKDKLLKDLVTMDSDRKFMVVDLIWETYKALYQLKLEENTQLALLDVREGKGTLDKEFYRRVREKTEKDMELQVYDMSTRTELQEVRKKLETLLAKPN